MRPGGPVAQRPPMRRPSLLVSVASLLVGCGDSVTPEGHLVSAETYLVPYASCAALEADLEAMLIEEVQAAIRSQPSMLRTVRQDSALRARAPRSASVSPVVAGRYLYQLDGARVAVFDTGGTEPIAIASETMIEGIPSRLLLSSDGARLVVVSQIRADDVPTTHALAPITGDQPAEDYEGGGDPYEEWLYRRQRLTKLSIFDLATPAQPQLVREVFSEGSIEDIGISGTTLTWTSWAQMVHSLLDRAYEQSTIALAADDIRATTLTDLTPQLGAQSPGGTFVTTGVEANDCTSVSRPFDSHANGIVSIRSLDLTDPTFATTEQHVIANRPAARGAADGILVVADNAHMAWWYDEFPADPRHTNVHVFSPLAYRGSGRVEGVVSLASLDPGDTVRVVSWVGGTTYVNGEPVVEDPVTTVSTFTHADGAAALPPTGTLALEVEIGNPRFARDRLYLPIFAAGRSLEVDLSDPEAPTLLGELPYAIEFIDASSELVAVTPDFRRTSKEIVVRSLSQPTGALSSVDHMLVIPAQADQLETVSGIAVWPTSPPLITIERDISYEAQLEVVELATPSRVLTHLGTVTTPTLRSAREVQGFVLGDTVVARGPAGISTHPLPDLALTAELPLRGLDTVAERWPR